MLVSAKDLLEKERMKRQAKKETYTKILVQLCRKINIAHTAGKDRTIVKIPEFIIGYPVYDMDMVTLYMHRQLKRLGYACSVLNTGYIHVAWKEHHKQHQNTVQDDSLPSLSNLKKAANTIRKKYT